MPEPLDHPEPELIDTRDAAKARAALERLGERTWAEALDWLYGTAAERPTATDRYQDLRRSFFGDPGRPSPAPERGTTADAVLDEFRRRLAPFAYAAQHPGSYSYFTPPPLPMAIAGETLARWLNLAGFPPGTLHVVPSDDDHRLRADAVGAAIDEDRAAGLIPFAIFGVAGSTNTGAIDDVPALADLAERESLWLHVDAAYGAAARISPREAAKLPSLERADSLTVDPHKWLFQPYDIGGLLVRRRGDLLRTFHREPEYYAVWGSEERPLHWYQYSVEGTRPFRALKLWLSWKHLGSRGFAQLIERNVDLARHLTDAARRLGFEVIEPQLAVVCFRLTPEGLDADATDELQKRLQRALEGSAAGWLSTTSLRGRTWLRAGVINYLSTEADADRILETLLHASERVLEDLDV